MPKGWPVRTVAPSVGGTDVSDSNRLPTADRDAQVSRELLQDILIELKTIRIHLAIITGEELNNADID